MRPFACKEPGHHACCRCNTMVALLPVPLLPAWLPLHSGWEQPLPPLLHPETAPSLRAQNVERHNCGLHADVGCSAYSEATSPSGRMSSTRWGVDVTDRGPFDRKAQSPSRQRASSSDDRQGEPAHRSPPTSGWTPAVLAGSARAGISAARHLVQRPRPAHRAGWPARCACRLQPAAWHLPSACLGTPGRSSWPTTACAGPCSTTRPTLLARAATRRSSTTTRCQARSAGVGWMRPAGSTNPDALGCRRHRDRHRLVRTHRAVLELLAPRCLPGQTCDAGAGPHTRAACRTRIHIDPCGVDLPQIHNGFTETSYITQGVRPHRACSPCPDLLATARMAAAQHDWMAKHQLLRRRHCRGRPDPVPLQHGRQGHFRHWGHPGRAPRGHAHG